MKLILLILIIAGLREAYEKKKNNKKFEIEKEILINEISEERSR
jgi:hypothetical protein